MIKINLKKSSLEKQQCTITLTENLPEQCEQACSFDVSYLLRPELDYYILDVELIAPMSLSCQRCMETFTINYDSIFSVAICHSDEQVKDLMTDFECISSDNGSVDLAHVICDELHFSLPIFHADDEVCKQNIAGLEISFDAS